MVGRVKKYAVFFIPFVDGVKKVWGQKVRKGVYKEGGKRRSNNICRYFAFDKYPCIFVRCYYPLIVLDKVSTCHGPFMAGLSFVLI